MIPPALPPGFLRALLHEIRRSARRACARSIGNEATVPPIGGNQTTLRQPRRDCKPRSGGGKEWMHARQPCLPLLEHVQADWKGGTVMTRTTSRAMTNRVIATIPVGPRWL
jgi:hypothetical protein